MSDTGVLFETDLRPVMPRGGISQTGTSLFSLEPSVEPARADAHAVLKVKQERNPHLVGGFHWVTAEPVTLALQQNKSVATFIEAHRAIAFAHWKIETPSAFEPVVIRVGDLESGRVSVSDALAFSNLDVVRGAWKPKLGHYLADLRTFFKNEYGVALAARLETLNALALDDNEQAPLSVQSVANLVRFLEKYRVRRPKLAASPSGELLAVWRQEGDGEFTARFLASNAVRFQLTRRNDHHPNGVSRISGDTVVDDLFGNARLSELDWVKL